MFREYIFNIPHFSVNCVKRLVPLINGMVCKPTLSTNTCHRSPDAVPPIPKEFARATSPLPRPPHGISQFRGEHGWVSRNICKWRINREQVQYAAGDTVVFGAASSAADASHVVVTAGPTRHRTRLEGSPGRGWFRLPYIGVLMEILIRRGARSVVLPRFEWVVGLRGLKTVLDEGWVWGKRL